MPIVRIRLREMGVHHGRGISFAARDLEAVAGLCRADVILRPPTTSERAGRTEPYRGFGHVEAQSGVAVDIIDVLWVWELRDGLVASVEVFQSRRPAEPTRRARPFQR